MDESNILQTLATARTEFEALVAQIRPELHRYCARMTGSVVEGEDVVQDTLAKAFYLLPRSDEIANLRTAYGRDPDPAEDRPGAEAEEPSNEWPGALP